MKRGIIVSVILLVVLFAAITNAEEKAQWFFLFTGTSTIVVGPFKYELDCKDVAAWAEKQEKQRAVVSKCWQG